MRFIGLFSLFLYCVNAFNPGMQPGVSAPFGFFDPLGFSKNKDAIEFKKLQESEIKHSRVAMLGSVGLIVQNYFHPLFNDEVIGDPIYHYQIVSAKYPWLTSGILGVIALIEIANIKKGWEMKSITDGIADLKEDYVPGDLGFDPLGLVKVPGDFEMMRTKELNNGRLAMIACLVYVVQHYINTSS